jgi:hypothetical protein
LQLKRNRRYARRMLLKVGAAVITLSLVLTAGVAAVVLRSETSATGFSANPRATVEKTAQEREFDLGQKLEIEDEVNEDGGVLEEDTETSKTTGRAKASKPPKKRSRSRNLSQCGHPRLGHEPSPH